MQPQQIGMESPGFMGGGKPHLQALASLSNIEIKEKASLLEAITAIIGAEVEMANKYEIFAGGTTDQVFYAVEETDCCTRQMQGCCPDCAPWSLNILYTQNGANQLVYKLKRDFTCTCCCFNRPVVTVTDATTGAEIGSIKDPCAICDLTFNIRDPQGEDALAVKGGCCQWGLCCPLPCGPCSVVNFDVEDAKSGQKVGEMEKKVPGCCKFLFASDVDNYKVEFGGVQNPDYKGMLMALAIFTDFRYFNDNKSDDSGGILGVLGGE